MSIKTLPNDNTKEIFNYLKINDLFRLAETNKDIYKVVKELFNFYLAENVNTLSENIQEKILTQYLPTRIFSLQTKDGSFQLASLFFNQKEPIGSEENFSKALVKAIKVGNINLSIDILNSPRKIDSEELGLAFTKAIEVGNTNLAIDILNSPREIGSWLLALAFIKAIKVGNIDFAIHILNLPRKMGPISLGNALITAIETGNTNLAIDILKSPRDIDPQALEYALTKAIEVGNTDLAEAIRNRQQKNFK